MNDDPKLRETLGAWRVSPQADPGFNTAVWRRIAGAEARARPAFWSRLRGWLLGELPRPAYAAGLILAAAMVGLTVANVQAGRMRDRYRREKARQYMASIDPLRMTGPGANRQ